MKAKSFIVISFILFSLAFSQSQKENLFRGAQELLESARNTNALLLSPENYRKGIAYYKSAEKDYEAGKDVSEVYNKLQNAETYLYKAVERSKINSEFFALTLKLKKEAEKSSKDKFSKQYLNEGEKHFGLAIGFSEDEALRNKIDNERKLANNFYEVAVIIAKNKKLVSPVLELKLKCEKNHADLFSPVNYQKGKKLLEDGFFFAKSGKDEKFVNSILSAEHYLKNALLISKEQSEANVDLLTAYSFAKKSGANFWADSSWEKALRVSKEGGALLEKGNKKGADSKFLIASRLFWDAEKEAIYSHYVKSLKLKLDSLTSEHPEKFAPNLTRRAELLISLADKSFRSNRYDQNLKKYFEQANKVLTRTKLIVNLYREKRQSEIDSLVLNNLYPFSEKKNVSARNEPITGGNASKSENAGGKNKLVDERKNEKLGSVTLTSKEEIIKSKKQTALSMDSLLKKEKTVNKTNGVKRLSPTKEVILNARKEFGKGEVVIFKEKKRVRIRLTGLKLAAYERKPSEKNREILKKLRNVINQSSGIKKIVIEVYSDSWGGDALNKKLSLVRAKTVKRYLIQLGVKSKLLYAKGIGNKNPIASNDTFEGRNKNRRVEVLFYLK